jgi:hypothetical protein
MTLSDMTQASAQLIEKNALLIAFALAALILIIYLARTKNKSFWLNYKTRRCLNRLGIKQIANIKWPDGLGHSFAIDRLILRQDGITVLNDNQYSGKIFCADSIEEWTQMVGQKSYRFKNPLYELDLQIKAISACIPGVPVNGFLFFHHLAEFPKGHPDRVIHMEKIPAELTGDKTSNIDASVEAAWNALLAKANFAGPGANH